MRILRIFLSGFFLTAAFVIVLYIAYFRGDSNGFIRGYNIGTKANEKKVMPYAE